jgi:hypothetical protein
MVYLFIISCLSLKIGFVVGDLETVFKAQTYSTVLAPK